MKFNYHPHLVGRHAFLSASKYHWIRYSDEHFDDVYRRNLQAVEGTRLHAIASELIKMRIKLPRTSKTLNLYVNDCISFRMQAEQMLVYSLHAFGTADAISYRNDVLRIFDLKTGITKVSVNQLEVYAALFCLEYEFDPRELKTIELRIYQNDDVQIYEADPNDIMYIMQRIKFFSKRIDELEAEAYR